MTDKKDFRRAIYARAAAICCALAAGLGYLWFGLLFRSIDTILFSVIAGLVVIIVLWPMQRMPTRAHARRLPYWLRTSRSGSNTSSEDGRNGK